ncbi:MAG: phospho-sugar mutase [Propionibacteriaceae bacterium]|nr:phospho-sugar mutase [Propionibacteriaceae bacterium]
MSVSAETLKAAKKWAAQDPDPDTKAELRALVERVEAGDEAAAAEVNDAFAGMLEFGTAGLRGRLGPGPGRMNRVTVIHAAEGVGAYLRQKAQFGAVLIGYDARHKSDEFAHEAAEIIGGVGHRPIVLDHPAPTPLIAFGIRELDCIAGIVVTASHNPPADNGFKVYLGDGRQIVAPADETIAHGMHRSAGRPLFMLHRSTDYRRLDDELEGAYLDRVARVVGTSGPRDIEWVYTPLHGVGRALVERVVDRLGFPAPHVVSEQADPDPDFPTVAFPNPEEPGAMDLALALASERDADVIIANDPDADRCAVGIPVGDGWRMLHGDEVGALLGDFLARRGATGTLANTIVSGSMLGRIAAAHGLAYARTLTGFKWISRVPDLAYGYEEALGYCCDPEAVADKDGISALALILTLAAEEKAAGRTLADRLDDLALAHGVHVSDQLSVRVEDLTLISAAMARLRAETPTELCGEPVEFIDLADGWGDLPATDGVRLAGETVTVTVRPSGTEPKLKCYLETRVSPEVTQRDLAGSRAEAQGMMTRLRAEMQAALGL